MLTQYRQGVHQHCHVTDIDNVTKKEMVLRRRHDVDQHWDVDIVSMVWTKYKRDAVIKMWNRCRKNETCLTKLCQ